MPRFGSSTACRRAARIAKMATIVVVSACQPECDDPTALNVQAVVAGRVSLNGEPLEGIVVRSGRASDVTSSLGSYSLTIQGAGFPLSPCVGPGTEPYAGAVASMATLPGCPLTLVDETPRTLDFAFTHTPPTLRIDAPADGAQLAPGTYELRATGTTHVALNGFTSPFPRLAVWSSSRDGMLGESPLPSIVSATLSPGTHTITATFTDDLAATVSDEVTVTVVDSDNQPPTATITSPESGLAYPNGATLDFAGTGIDPEDGPLTGDALVWTSSQEGQLGTGASFSRVMAAGSHVIVLRATDTQGASATDTIFIHINEPASGNGTIQGSVTIGGEPLADIPVALSGSASANTVTNGQGLYSFTDLPAGPYTVTITPPAGADITTQQSVTLAEGQTLTVNFAG